MTSIEIDKKFVGSRVEMDVDCSPKKGEAECATTGCNEGVSITVSPAETCFRLSNSAYVNKNNTQVESGSQHRPCRIFVVCVPFDRHLTLFHPQFLLEHMAVLLPKVRSWVTPTWWAC